MAKKKINWGGDAIAIVVIGLFFIACAFLIKTCANTIPSFPPTYK